MSRAQDLLLCAADLRARPVARGVCVLEPGCGGTAAWTIPDGRAGCTPHVASWLRGNH